MILVVPELACVQVSILGQKRALPVLLAIVPLSLVLLAVGVGHCSPALPLIMHEVAIIQFACTVPHLALSMLEVI